MVYGVCHFVLPYPVSGRYRQITVKVPNVKLRDNPPCAIPSGVRRGADVAKGIAARRVIV